MKSYSPFIYILILFISACNSPESSEQYVERGNNFYQDGNWNSAIIEYKNAIKQSSDNAEIRVLLGQSYMKVGNYISAIKEFKRAIKLGVKERKVILPIAKSFLYLENFKKIVDEVDPELVAAISTKTKSTKAQLYAIVARAHINFHDDTRALNLLNQASKLENKNKEVQLAWAIYEKSKGNLKEQKERLKPLLNQGVADAWSQWGEIKLSEKNFKGAVDAYTKSINTREFIHPDLLRRALVYLDMGKLDKAQMDLDTLVKGNTNWVAVTHTLGLMALKNKELIRARGLFQKVLSSNPDYSPSKYYLAIIESRENNLQNALSLIEQYTGSIQGNVHANLLHADLLIKLDKVDKAQVVLKSLFEKNGKDPRVLVLLARSYLKQNDIDRAVDFFKKTIALNPDDALARLQLGQALLSQKSTIKLGRQELEKTLKINSSLIEAYMALYKSYLQEKKFDNARRVASRVSDRFKNNSTGSNLNALSYLQQGKKQIAINLLIKTLERFPGDSMTSQNLAKIYLFDQKLSEAKDLYQEVLLSDPSNIKVLAQLASINAREGNKEQTMFWLKKAVDLNPGNFSPKLMLAAEYLVREQARLADQLLTPEETTHQNNPMFLLVMSQIQIALDNNQKALRMLKQLVANIPSSLSAHMLTAKVYAKTNEPEKLRDTLNRVIELQPDSFEANIVLARLDLLEKNDESFKKIVLKLTKTHPDHPDVMWLEAKMNSSNKQYEGAILTLSDLMNKKPSSGVVKELARNQWRSGNREAAISSLEIWLRSNPDDIIVLSDIAEYYAIEKRYNDARVVYSKLNKLFPNNPQVLNNLAWLLKDIDTKLGIDYANQSLKIKPEDPVVMDTLATLYLINNQPVKALEYSRTAFEKIPGSGEIQLNHAKVLIANNEIESAKRVLTRLLQKTESVEISTSAQIELNKINK